MGWFSRWLGARRSGQSEFERLGGKFDGFAVLAMGHVPIESLTRHPRKQRNVIAFHFGAINHLAAMEALDETQTLALYVRFLQKNSFGATPQTGSVSHFLEEFAREHERGEYLQAGQEAMQYWMADGNDNAAKRLSEMLRLIQG